MNDHSRRSVLSGKVQGEAHSAVTWRVEDKGKGTKGSRDSLCKAPTAEERIV